MRVKYTVTIDPCTSAGIQPTSYSTSQDNHYFYNYQGGGKIISIGLAQQYQTISTDNGSGNYSSSVLVCPFLNPKLAIMKIIRKLKSS